MKNIEHNQMSYIGKELEVFANAQTWKNYVYECIKPYLGNTVIEVGAGIGANTQLMNKGVDQWLCVEPDKQLSQCIENKILQGELPQSCHVENGFLTDLPSNTKADTILYIDVLEHIQDDEAEVSRATRYLRPGGHLIVLSPAHQMLFSKFDTHVGHYRRYNIKELQKLAGSNLHEQESRYIDSVGLFASLLNKVALKQSIPTQSQIRFWDNRLVPASLWFDKITRYKFGKSALIVWKHTP